MEPKPLEMCVSLRAEVLSVRDFVARGGSLEDFFMEYGSLDQHADSPGDRRITEKENDCLVTVFNQVLRCGSNVLMLFFIVSYLLFILLVLLFIH